jgi:hypothetical protein
MAGMTISTGTANDMITNYNDYMKDLGVDMDNQTQNVSFTGGSIMTWLTGVMQYSDELRIFMGRYAEDIGTSNAGRTTVIVWPYSNGVPARDNNNNAIDPYNEGSLRP